MLVPPMSSASTGCSGTGALQQPRLLEDGPDPRHDLRVVDGGHRCGHHIGRQHSQLRSEEHTSELQSRGHLVCRLLLEKKKKKRKDTEQERGGRNWVSTDSVIDD